jgi:glycosyltransferase involved in cell wall biosynthesis
MVSINIIYLVESSSRHEWIEKLIAYLDERGFSQSFISIEPRGEINSYIRDNFPRVQVHQSSRRRLSITNGVLAIRRLKKENHLNILFALGHQAGFISGVATLFTRIIFVFSHMQQPHFFNIIKQRHRKIAHKTAYRFYIRRAKKIHSLSAEVYESLVSKNIPVDRIEKIFIGMDFSRIEKQLDDTLIEGILTNGSPSILMVGRLSPEKNCFLALESFKFFLESEPNATLYFAGDGPLKDKIVKKVEEEEISDKVFFLGKVSNIPKLMTQFDFLLHLATTESYGQIYTEALLSRLPVVCTRTGIAIDFYQNNVPGFHLVSSQNSRHICDVMLKCYRTENVNRRIFNNKFEDFKEHDISEVFKRIATIFLNLAI